MSRQECLNRLRGAVPVIAPSMLKCDFSSLRQEVEHLTNAGAVTLHWDVMDGHFVPNLSYGAMVIKTVRHQSDLLFDAHLMISDPEKYLDDFLAAGCDLLTLHIEAAPQPLSLLQKIKDSDRLCGLALNPGTPVAAVLPWIPHCDQVLVMSVEPGFGGQSFMPEVLSKVEELSKRLRPDQILAIDGGIGSSTIQSAAGAGAGYFVVGSAIFDQTNYREAISQLSELARASSGPV